MGPIFCPNAILFSFLDCCFLPLFVVCVCVCGRDFGLRFGIVIISRHILPLVNMHFNVVFNRQYISYGFVFAICQNYIPTHNDSA